ncbi:hypothetical protein M413DRAFT_267423 [Hebeloma cylindrosporum]|uniref:Uncharacterized protein n=1 Tax=Hebeloma cylindrosporum TaxID=76867 RepID=A0A0C2Z1D3_HEBCY|nr:hypothetical protein M413DRAFT_267423 [Hebeloma cylindrosporum h7]
MQGMKAELKHLLSQPLLAKGISARYITSGSRPIVDDLLAGELNETMVGLKKAEAGSEMAVAKKKKAKKQTQAAAAVKDEQLEEEWSGITEVAL